MPLTTNSTTISDFFQAVEDTLQADLGGRVETIGDYDEITAEGTINTPAVLLDLSDFDEADDSGDERTAVNCRMSVYCVLSAPDVSEAGGRPELSVRDFAAKVFAIVKAQKVGRFGLGAALGNPLSVDANPAGFEPEKEGLLTWVVSWSQLVYLGTDPAYDAQTKPDTVLVSMPPDIGLGHELDYEEIMQ